MPSILTCYTVGSQTHLFSPLAPRVVKRHPLSLAQANESSFSKFLFFAGGFAAHNSGITKQEPRETSRRVQSHAIVFQDSLKKLQVSRNSKLVKHRGSS